MRKLQFLLAFALPSLILGMWAIPASAAPAPVTYLNANFGPPNDSGIGFYRSSGTIQFQSATASVTAKAKNSQVEFSAYANNDAYETSSGFSSYDVGTVNAGPGSMNGLSVSPRTLLLSGSAHFASLGGDVYGIGPSGNGPVSIDATTPLFLIGPGGAGGCNGSYVATLAFINAGGCFLTIPANTNVARWVGIDIANGTQGSGSAAL